MGRGPQGLEPFISHGQRQFRERMASQSRQQGTMIETVSTDTLIHATTYLTSCLRPENTARLAFSWAGTDRGIATEACSC
jgi:hypothetical protein